MCGIAGFLTDPREPPSRDWLERMNEALVHRGPDGQGCFLGEGVALGHRRLSIIDLAGGAQPIGNEDGSVQVVFNGEIYNYRELRKDLEARGHRFATHTDTEVLVHLYEEAGERMPEHLNGMFALALWDARRRELFLARDRMGKKPLYYASASAGTRFCFASELKALARLPLFSARVDPGAVAQFLSLSYIPDPQTIYEGVFRLPAGCSLTVAGNTPRLRQYWAPSFETGPGRRLEDGVEELRALARDAVERRLMSDVPLGAFLSGGVDSSATVAYMALAAPERVKTFSIGFTSKEFDELPYARKVVDRYRTEHREEVVTPRISEMLGTLVEHYDEPFGDSSAIPMLYLARMTRRQVTVALCGDGADEVFGGYRRYYFGVLEERLRRRFPSWFRRSVIRLGGTWYPKFDYLPRPLRARTMLANLAGDLGDAYFTSLSTFRDGDLEAVLSPGLRSALDDGGPRAGFRRRFERVAHWPPLSQMQAVDFETYLAGDILVKADRATMAYSLESRSPWLDYRLVELAGRMPPEFKLAGRTGKFIFKQAMSPLVPETLVRRTKMGFSVPLAEWFRTSLRSTFRACVLRPEMERYLNLAEARRLYEQHQSGLHNHERRLWNLLMLACWDLRYVEKVPAEEIADRGRADD